MRTRSLLSLAIASTALVGAARLDAQPTRDHRAPPPPPPQEPVRDHRAPPPATTGPTEAPPTPREEKFAARAGFVWIAGRWDWKGKWEWVPGHWERERAGQSWHPGHWDKNGATWVWSEGSWSAGGAPPPVVTPPPTTPPPTTPPPGEVRDHRPHRPPPAPHTETATTKPGFIWVAGHWDWQNDDWKWIDGHWERERAHKKWRQDRWDLQGDTYVHVGGDWVDEGAAEPPPTNTGIMPPVPPPGNDHTRDHRHDWRIDRPAVSSYWPNKGKAGTRVVIHGVNFPADATVMWGSEPIKAAKVSPDRIMFEVPPTATSGTIALRRDHGRDLIVGPFEVAAIDAEAELKRIAEEQRKAAEAAWVTRQKDLAKDRAAREAAWRQREQELEASREQRRQERVAAIRAKFQAAFLADPDTQAELTMHAERVAQLGRAREVAEIQSNGKLVIRIDVATTRETTRHDERMTALEQAFRTKGGAP